MINQKNISTLRIKDLSPGGIILTQQAWKP
jgi:hypothetical protein